jgi:NADH-quinone oxidoreductase subunit C
MKEMIDKIAKRYKIEDIVHKRANLVYLTIDKDEARDLILNLRDIEGFRHLVLITAVDWLEEGLFQLTYMLNNPAKRCDIGLRVMIDRDDASMTSIHDLWQQARTYQRELHEMFGIDFPGSPNVDKPFILEGWDNIPPYRRDFDTKKYAEETYFPRPGRESRDPAGQMKQKLYPKD